MALFLEIFGNTKCFKPEELTVNNYRRKKKFSSEAQLNPILDKDNLHEITDTNDYNSVRLQLQTIPIQAFYFVWF